MYIRAGWKGMNSKLGGDEMEVLVASTVEMITRGLTLLNSLNCQVFKFISNIFQAYASGPD